MTRLDGKKAAMWPWIALVCLLVALAAAGYFWYENRDADGASVDVTSLQIRLENKHPPVVHSRSLLGLSQLASESSSGQLGRYQRSPMHSLGAKAPSTGGQS